MGQDINEENSETHRRITTICDASDTRKHFLVPREIELCERNLVSEEESSSIATLETDC